MVRSSAVIVGVGPTCKLIGDSSGLSMGTFATPPLIAYYSDQINTVNGTASVTGYFMVPRGFDVVGYKYVIASRCTALNGDTDVVPCNTSSAYVTCGTAQCITILDTSRTIWNTILVPRTYGKLQVCVQGAVPELYYAEIVVTNITCVTAYGVLIDPILLHSPSASQTSADDACLRCPSCTTTKGSDVVIVDGAPTMNGLCIDKRVCDFVMNGLDAPVAVKRPYSANMGTPPSDYSGMACVHHAAVIPLSWSSLASMLGTSFFYPMASVCTDVQVLSKFMFSPTIVSVNTTKTAGWTLYDYAFSADYSIVVLIDVPLSITVLVAGGMAYVPVPRGPSTFHILDGLSRRVVFRVPAAMNDVVVVSISAIDCALCKPSCAADPLHMLGRLSDDGNVTVLYATSVHDVVDTVPENPALSCAGETPLVGLTPQYIRNLTYVLAVMEGISVPATATWSQIAGTTDPIRKLMLSLVSHLPSVPQSYRVDSRIVLHADTYVPALATLFFSDNGTARYSLIPSPVCMNQINLVNAGCVRVIVTSTGADLFPYGDLYVPVFGPFRNGIFPYNVQVRAGSVNQQILLRVLIQAIQKYCMQGVLVFDAYCRSGVSCHTLMGHGCVQVNLRSAGARQNYGLQYSSPHTRNTAPVAVRISPVVAIVPMCDITNRTRRMMIAPGVAVNIRSVAQTLGCTGRHVNVQSAGGEPISGLKYSVGCMTNADIAATKCGPVAVSDVYVCMYIPIITSLYVFYFFTTLSFYTHCTSEG